MFASLPEFFFDSETRRSFFEKIKAKIKYAGEF